ncbi:MAG TPA: hypothetical protein VHG28_05945 [Longimicrobiaceae bacterium]|nr:hypothetical protein [Longimicrobiaceae bacterium]
MRLFLLGLVFLLAAAPAAAQEIPGADTLGAAGRRDGRAAADRRGVGGYMVAGFVGGALTGFFTPLALGTDDRSKAGTLAVGGLATATAAASQGGGGEVRLPPELEWRIRERERPYWQAFRAEYAERVRERRRGAVLRGGAVGVAAGLGGLVVLLLLDSPLR